jgi:radical SAM protein with 4Fe4S-binding SPASM domain
MDTELYNIPKPYPETELYRTILESGFDKFPERKENYKIYQNSSRSSNLNYLPIKLDVENVSRCNYRCQMCSVSEWKKGTRARDMTLDEFKLLIDQQYGVIELKIQGLGEPFLSKDFVPMVQYARKRHIWVRSTTNASLLDRNENYKKVIDADISELQVSIDGGTKETFEKIRTGSRFEKVVKNTILLNDYASRVNKHRTRAWSLIQKDNFHESELIVKLCSNLGFKRLTFSLDVEDTAWSNNKKRQVTDLDKKDNFNLKMVNKLLECGRSNNIDVSFWMTFDKFDLKNADTLCSWPFERAVISSDMRIVPCCMIANPDVYELGKNESLSESWNSESYVNFREMHLNSKLPDICKNCYLR